ncbi:MAG TPA: efflux RND transporter periplasmic adaptor subunit [Kofleriaceae bacterium]|nr:efflux RND transporter periplasmic adaptor subunit [Kofleriaceae bacterium]
MKLSRWLPRIAVVGVLVGLGVFLWIRKPWAKGDEEITFSTVAVGKGNIAAQVTANGTLSAHTTVQVGAQVNGRVIELHADFNDPVKKGQLLAKLDPTIYKANLEQAQANLDQAVANVKKAEVAEMDGKRQYDRNIELRKQSLISDYTVEQTEVTYKEAVANTIYMKAQVEQNIAQLAQAKANLDYCQIYSPIDGVVLTRSYDIGQTVQSSFSAPTLFTIAEDLSRMQIDTSVAEADVGRLAEKMKATFSVDAYPGKTFEGIVRQVRNSPTTTQGVVTYDAVIDVDNSNHMLRPGMTANITFVLDQVADAIKIPNAALRFKPSRDQMMAIAERFGMHRGSGSGHHHGSGDGGSGDAPKTPRPDGVSSASSAPAMKFGDKKPVWKLVDGKPKMILVKPGLTDGSSTQLLEASCLRPGDTGCDLEPGDLLITEINGLPTTTNTRKIGAF